MANEKGVWRTIGGRRVFIKEGQDLASAMKESGKFKSANKFSKREELKKDIAHQVTEAEKNGNTAHAEAGKRELERLNNEEKEQVVKDYENGKISSEEALNKFYGQEDKMIEAFEKMGYTAPTKENVDKANKRHEEFMKDLKNKDIEKENQKSLEQQYAEDLHNGKTNGTYKQWLDKKNGKTDFTREELNNLERIGEKKVEIPKEKDSKTPYEKGEKYRNSIIETAKNSKEDNVTLDTETGKVATFDKGYSVSFQQSSDNYDDKEYYEKVEECRNKCDGKLYAGKYGGDAEASFHTDDIETAKELMYKYNQESIYDWEHETLIMNDKYDSSSNKTNYEAEKSTNDIMNEKIRSRGKAEDDLPKHVEIKSQGTSNRKEVSENIQAHILEYYDSPEDFISQMDNMRAPTMWHAGERLAGGGSYLIYYDDQRKFLDGLKINPKGKNFSDDRVFQTYKSLIGRESAKLYNRIQKNSYKKYMKAHPLSKMSFEEFKNMRGGK